MELQCFRLSFLPLSIELYQSSASLVVMNCLSLCLSWNVLISLSVLKESSAKHSHRLEVLSHAFSTIGLLKFWNLLWWVSLCKRTGFFFPWSSTVSSLLYAFDIMTVCYGALFLWLCPLRPLSVSYIWLSTSFSRLKKFSGIILLGSFSLSLHSLSAS